MTTNDSKSFLSYSKLTNENNNTYHQSIDNNSIDADYPDWTDKVDQVPKHLNLKLVIESGLLSIRRFLVKITHNIAQRKGLWLILCWKLIL